MEKEEIKVTNAKELLEYVNNLSEKVNELVAVVNEHSKMFDILCDGLEKMVKDTEE